MAIQTVRVKLLDTWTTLTYNPATGRYEGQITPPGTSFHQPGGYYSLAVEAVGEKGDIASASGDTSAALRLVVKETVSPVVTLVSPAPGYLTTQAPTFVFTALDETGGSGVDPDSAQATVDGAPATVTAAPIDGGYQFTFSAENLADGPHTVSLTVSDNDGNPASASGAYTVDTTPPELRITLPDARRVVDVTETLVSGYVFDFIGPGVTVEVSNNGRSVASVPITGQGPFAVPTPLDVGDNNIVVTVTDSAGLVTQDTIYMIRLVTDRAQADLTELQDLASRSMETWTAEEKTWYETAIVRGAYNTDDLNRVGTAVNYLNGALKELGYAPNAHLSTDWVIENIPTAADMSRYLLNVDKIRTAQGFQTVSIPQTMEDLTLAGANSIEKALVKVADYFPYYTSWTAGEIFCGEM